jgi:hypothetical protein
MRPSDWRKCLVPRLMLEFVRNRATDRKYRLLTCAALRSVWDRLPDDRCREAVELAERYAEGRATDAERQATWQQMERARDQALVHGAQDAAMWYRDVRNALAEHLNQYTPPAEINGRKLCDLIRDLFMPFPGIQIDPDWLAWNNGTVAKMARVIYDERRFAEVPILGDALEEAGCMDQDILVHCRAPKGVHVAGCWVLDLLLNQS